MNDVNESIVLQEVSLYKEVYGMDGTTINANGHATHADYQA